MRTSTLEKHPDIKAGQFTVQFLDRNTGIVLDHDFNYARSDRHQKVYSIHNSLADAMDYAEQKMKTTQQDKIDVGFFIRDNNQNIVFHTDNL